MTTKNETTKSTITTNYGSLHDYTTGEYIRAATQAERQESDAEVEAGHYEGVIVVDGRSCYVQP